MANILIKILPPQGIASPSTEAFDKAFKDFFALPQFKALFAELLKSGDICFTFSDQETIGWLPATREMLIPLRLLNGPLIMLFENIAALICLISKIDNPVLAQRLMMLSQQQQTPELFDQFSLGINVIPQKLVQYFVTLASEEKLNPEQEHTVMLAKLNVNYHNLDKDQALRMRKWFELLIQNPVFRDLLMVATKENAISLQFVDKRQLRANESVMHKPGGYYYIDKEADLINITDTLMKHFADSKHTVFKYADYNTADEYATALLKATFDATCFGAQNMIALFKSSNAKELMGNVLQRPTSDPIITPALMTILEMYQKNASANFEIFINENQDYYNSMKISYLEWQQKNAMPSSSSCLSSQIEDYPEPMVESYKRHSQTAESSVAQVSSAFEKLRACVDKYKSYACSDARNYAQCINPEKKVDILKRYAQKPVHLLQYEAQANQAAHAIIGQYSEKSLMHIGKLIDMAKSGCCTTFAIAALSKLQLELSDCRIQMLASQVEEMTAHCFLLVEDKLTGESFVADPWLASLGWEGVYTLKEYPFKHYLEEGVYCCFDSQKVPSPRALSS